MGPKVVAGLRARAHAGRSRPPSAVGSRSSTTTRLETGFASAMGTIVAIHSGGAVAEAAGTTARVAGVAAACSVDNAPVVGSSGGLDTSTDCQPAGVLRSLAN